MWLRQTCELASRYTSYSDDIVLYRVSIWTEVPLLFNIVTGENGLMNLVALEALQTIHFIFYIVYISFTKSISSPRDPVAVCGPPLISSSFSLRKE